MIIRIIIAVVALLSFLSPAQSDSLEIQTEQVIEDIFEEPSEETDISDLYEEIEYYIDNPVNLNEGSVRDLSAIPYLDLSSARLIIEHRNSYGKFFSSNELYSLPGLSEELVKKVLPFLCVEITDPKQSLPEQNTYNISYKMRNRILSDLQDRRGFTDNLYLGSPIRLYNRINLKYSDKIEVGILTDKDAGEKSYYDFYSGYLNLSGFYHFNNIVLGDYKTEFGQGLTLWGPFGQSRGSDAIYPVKRKSGNIKPYKSSSETNFFRGAAAEYEWEHVNISGFYSHNFIDANIDSVTGKITSTPLDGLHRTNSELYKRKSIAETSYGISLNYNKYNTLTAGILYYTSIFNHSFLPSKIYDIEGSNFNYYSGYIDLYLKYFNLFGEYSFDGKSIASVSCLELSPCPEFSYVLLIRNYPRNYINLHGTGFGKRSGALQNEFGIYNGLRWSTSLGVFNFYYDQFTHPFATAENSLPSEGYEYMMHLSSRLNKEIDIHARIKINNKEITESIDNVNQMVRQLKQSCRFELVYTFSRYLRLKTRLEYSRYLVKSTDLSEEGYMLFEDLRIQPLTDFVVYLRVIFFRTDSFNSAIYEFENDMAGTMNNAGLYGEGARLYFVLRYKLLNNLSLSFKYSETYKPKETSIGTGYQLIDGNIDNRIGLQFDFTL